MNFSDLDSNCPKEFLDQSQYLAAGSGVVGAGEADLELWKNWWVNLEGEQESEQICSVL